MDDDERTKSETQEQWIQLETKVRSVLPDIGGIFVTLWALILAIFRDLRKPKDQDDAV